MTRSYTLKRRAEQQAGTRLRIVEAAVELHGQFGPAQTTLSMVAERAGVQRHTLYAHFPDERSLLMACSGLTLERDALPDASAWRTIADRNERLRTGLAALYAWFERNADLIGCVLRDAEFHPLTREVSELRMGPFMAACAEVLGVKLNARQRAMLQLALSFFTWRTLARDSGLKSAAAAKAMAHAIAGASEA
ncbi:MAG TPA: helix-turn-helix domain-containing protein [Bradyrhizobium sp.]|nr:helix-turn-helix domain-containing protein [Bradyrhizobium sp.]